MVSNKWVTPTGEMLSLFFFLTAQYPGFLTLNSLVGEYDAEKVSAEGRPLLGAQFAGIDSLLCSEAKSSGDAGGSHCGTA